MGRRLLPTTMMVDAIDQKDVEALCWALIEQARKDMGKKESEKVFNSADLISIIRQLIVLTNKGYPDTIRDKDDKLDEWMDMNKTKRDRAIWGGQPKKTL